MNEALKGSGENRIECVDALRGFGILLVMYIHANFTLVLHRYALTICTQVFFFLSGYFLNCDKPFWDIFKKKARTLLLPYYVFGIFYYIVWLLMFYGQGRDLIAPLEAVLFMPTEAFPVESALYFFPSLFFSVMILVLIEKRGKNEIIKGIMVLALTLLGYIWVPIFKVRLPMGLDISFAILMYIYLGYHGRAIMGFINKFLDKISKKWIKVLIFAAVALINLYFINRTNLTYIKNGIWGPIPISYINTCLLMLVLTYFFRWADRYKLTRTIIAPLKYFGVNSAYYLCFGHVALFVGMFAVKFIHINKTARDLIFYIISILVVIPIIELFKHTKLHKIFG